MRNCVECKNPIRTNQLENQNLSIYQYMKSEIFRKYNQSTAAVHLQYYQILISKTQYIRLFYISYKWIIFVISIAIWLYIEISYYWINKYNIFINMSKRISIYIIYYVYGTINKISVKILHMKITGWEII